MERIADWLLVRATRARARQNRYLLVLVALAILPALLAALPLLAQTLSPGAPHGGTKASREPAGVAGRESSMTMPPHGLAIRAAGAQQGKRGTAPKGLP